MAESYEHLAVRCAEAWVRFCYEYAKERDGGRKFRFGDAPEWSKKERSDAGKACDAAFDAFADAFDAQEREQ